MGHANPVVQSGRSTTRRRGSRSFAPSFSVSTSVGCGTDSCLDRRGGCGPLQPMPTDMEIAGIVVDGLAVIELADRLLYAGHMDTAALLLIAHAHGDERVELNLEDREAVIEVLGDTPDTLAELRDALLVEQMSRSLGQMA